MRAGIVTLLGCLVAGPAIAQQEDPPKGPRARVTDIGWKRTFGVGAIVGVPNGVTGKLYLDQRGRLALDSSLGVTFSGATVGYVDYLVHPFPIVRTARIELPWHIGGGPLMGGDDIRSFWGLRAVAGIDVDTVDWPVQFFGDFAVTGLMGGNKGLSFGYAAGIRWYPQPDE